MEKTIFIINPNSAKGQYHKFIDQLKSLVQNPAIYISQSKEDCHNFLETKIKDYDIIVAVGGDGTISSIAEKLLFSNKILAVFPMGSGNGFARENNFSNNIKELINKIQSKKSKSIDSIKIGEYVSINVSGVGLDSEVANRFEKTSRGLLNYIKVTFSTFFKFKGIKVTFDDQLKINNGDYFMLNIANTKQFGNNAYIAPKAIIDDGKADIVLVKKTPVYLAPKFLYQLFNKKLRTNPYLKFTQVKECEITTNSELWHIDGDTTIIQSPVTIKVLPESLNILI